MGTSATNGTDGTIDHIVNGNGSGNGSGVGNGNGALVATTENSPRYSNEYVLNFAFLSFIGFVCVQAVFSIIANSQAMLADSEAMAVDALTYLFNLCAERIKNRPLSKKELNEMSDSERTRRREIQRLYLELVPPAVSVVTLIAVTISTLREACHSLRGIEDPGNGDDDDDVSITIMLVFSGANLLLDVVNVTCFAKADVAFGLDVVRRENYSIKESIKESMRTLPSTSASTTVPDETTRLVMAEDEGQDAQPSVVAALSSSESGGSNSCREYDFYSPTDLHHRSHRISSSELTPSKDHDIVNLNMCSAWTHVCADTLRSVAVLVAAGFAFLLPQIQPDVADSVAAIIVSLIILGSLLPLLQGLCLTTLELYSLLKQRA